MQMEGEEGKRGVGEGGREGGKGEMKWELGEVLPNLHHPCWAQ